jgi:hypothetical protein
MAATVLNGTTSNGSISWTNNTGGNVRLIVNYFGNPTPASTNTSYGVQIAIGSATYRAPIATAVGKNLATYTTGTLSQVNMSAFGSSGDNSLPVELYIPIATTLTLSRITGSGEYSYNLLLLPENG